MLVTGRRLWWMAKKWTTLRSLHPWELLCYMAAENDKQESAWVGWDQWHKLWSATKKVELARSHTKERGWERLFYSVNMDSWRSEGMRKTKNYLEKDSRERAKQSWVEELGSTKWAAQNWKHWSDNVEALCAYYHDETWWWPMFVRIG